MVKATPSEVADGALLTLVRQVLDRFDRVEGKIDDTRERVIAIESNRMDERVEALKGQVDKAEARIGALEADLHQRRGAVGLIGWLAKRAPWLTALIAAAVAGSWLDKKL